MQMAFPSSQGLELEACHWLCLSIFLKKLGRYLISHIMEDDGWLLWIYHSKFFSSPENSPALSLASRHFHFVGKAPIVLNITFSHFNFCSKTSFVLNKYLSLWRYIFSHQSWEKSIIFSSSSCISIPRRGPWFSICAPLRLAPRTSISLVFTLFRPLPTNGAGYHWAGVEKTIHRKSKEFPRI